MKVNQKTYLFSSVESCYTHENKKKQEGRLHLGKRLWVDLRNLWKVQHNSGRETLVEKGITVEREIRMCIYVTLAGDQNKENHGEIQMRGVGRVDDTMSERR